MESGLFNNIIKIDNYVIKISKRDSEISNQVMTEMSSGTPEEYAMHINNVGIKTAKIQSSFMCDDYDILVQEYIEGKTIQQLLNDENIDINTKVRTFEKFINLLYYDSVNNEFYKYIIEGIEKIKNKFEVILWLLKVYL